MPRDSSHSATKLWHRRPTRPSGPQWRSQRANSGWSLCASSRRADSGAARYKRRVEAGRLQRLWRGVYAFGHSELRLEGRLLGAVFTCGPGAVLSRRSAADHWGILRTNRAGHRGDRRGARDAGETARHRPPLHPPPRPKRRHRSRRHPHHHRRPHPGRPLRRRPAPHGREGAGAVLRAAVDRSGSHRGRTGASPRPEDQCTEEACSQPRSARRPSPAASSKRRSSPYAAGAACRTQR